MTEKPLYDDGKFKVDYLPDSSQDHELYIKDASGEDLRFIIQRGILEDCALTEPGGIERKFTNCNSALNDYIMLETEKRLEGNKSAQDTLQLNLMRKVEWNNIHIVLCQAYIEQERRINSFNLDDLREKIDS